MLEGLLTGLSLVLQWQNILLIFAGCFAGTFIGLLPGLGPMTAIALMIPVAAGLPASSGIMVMAAVYYGAIFGGSTSAILINAPGVASTVATSFDGFPLTRQGQAGKALAIAALASFGGGILGALLLLVAGSQLSGLALSFQSSDYLALIVFAMVCVSFFTAQDGVAKGLAMTLLGAALATVGADQTQGVPRFTFGSVELLDGVSFLLLVMATFALSEALLAIMERRSDLDMPAPKLEVEKADIQEIAKPVARSSILGFFIGLLPGAGATIASLLAYGSEQRLAPQDQRTRFGKGHLPGLAAPEAANNAAATGSFVPLLSLGIPGSGTTAVILGALMAYGVQPGPMLQVLEPELFWSVIASMWIGNVFLLILNLPLIPWIARLCAVRGVYLYPTVMMLSLMGIYLVSFNPFDLQLMVLFAVSAVVFRILGFPMAPLILGFILGGMIEEYLARALLIYDGQWTFLWQRPLTAFIACATFLVLISPLLKRLWTSLRGY